VLPQNSKPKFVLYTPALPGTVKTNRPAIFSYEMLTSEMSEEETPPPVYKLRLPLYLGIAMTPILVILAAVSGGVGHGSYLPAIILFPYATALIAIIDATGLHSLSPWFVLPLALLQYPLYGRLIGMVWVGKLARFYLVGIGLAHVLVLILIYTVGGGW
jgi:hypothetical protein